MESLNAFSENDISGAVWDQINFQKEAIKSKVKDKSVFQITHNQHKFSIAEKIQHLKIILEENNILADTMAPGLTVKTVVSAKDQLENHKQSLIQTLMCSRRKRAAQAQKELLPDYISNPEKLVNKTIQHQCREQKGGTQQSGLRQEWSVCIDSLQTQ